MVPARLTEPMELIVKGSLLMTSRVPIRVVRLGGRLVRVVVVEQAELGMRLDVDRGDQVNAYCNNSNLRIVAALFDTASANGDVVIMARHDPTGADLVVFRRTDTPLNFPGYRRLRNHLRSRPPSDYITARLRPEQVSDRSDEHWRQLRLITVRTQDNVVLFGGTSYGLRQCALACEDLIERATTDHYHWDKSWMGTSKTTEFIMRNVDSPW